MIIGLTGGIASGKSTAAKYLGELGAHVIDADVLGHRAYEPGTGAFQSVVAAFGDDIVSPEGQIDRKALGGKVFGKPEALKSLTDIVWPEIRRLAEAEMADVQAREPNSVVVLEAAVLFEAGWEDAVEEVWVVVVDPEIAVQRAMHRDGTDAETVQRRIAAQLSNDERKARADVVIDNSSDEAAMHAQVDSQWRRVTGENAA